MAINFDEMAPVKGTGLAKRQGIGRAAGPNPFLERGWLQDSYDTGADMQFGPVTGEYVDYTVKSGESAGQVRQKATGDLAEVIGLIRAASNKLGIGAVVQVTPAVNERNKPIKGQWFVLYLGKDRKAPRKNKGNSTTV